MPELVGLPGTDGSARECAFVTSFNGVRKALAKGVAATSAGDNGALNIWKDDDGNYRCERMRFMSVKHRHTVSRIADIKAWFKEAYAAII